MNAAEALLIAKYEVYFSSEGLGMPTTDAEDALTQQAILMSWDSLDTWDRAALAQYWKTPEAGS